MKSSVTDELLAITTLHTLGPAGTNLEAAAAEWFRRRGCHGVVRLHETLEAAVPTIPRDGAHALLACAAYPLLHELVFTNLDHLRMVDTFLLPTHSMVLATSGPDAPRSVLTHPAPRALVPAGLRVTLATSNASAAVDCRNGRAEGCITTLPAARAQALRIVRDFGPVPMAYTVHLAVATHKIVEPTPALATRAANVNSATVVASSAAPARDRRVSVTGRPGDATPARADR